MSNILLVIKCILFCSIFISGISQIKGTPLKPTEIIISIPSRSNSLSARAIKRFAEELEKNAPGQFKVRMFFGGSSAVSQGKEIPAIREGRIHMALASAADFYEVFKGHTDKFFSDHIEKEKYFAALEIQMMPFIFRDQVHVQHVLDTYLNPIIIPATRKLGLEILGLSYHGTRILEVTYDRPIIKPADIQLGELRAPEGAAWRKVATCLVESESFRAIPHSEVKAFIKSKSIKVLEFPLASFRALDMDASFKQIVLTNHLIHYLYWVFSTQKLKELSGEQKTVLLNAAKEAIRYNDEECARQEQRLLEFYKTIFRVTLPDLGAFRLQTEKMFRESLASSVFEGLYRKIVELR